MRGPAVATMLALSLVAGSAGCGRLPEEHDVCQHLLEIVGQTNLEACAENMAGVRERMGSHRYRLYARCILRAESVDALLSCEP
mgnify:CR=1 FL=1